MRFTPKTIFRLAFSAVCLIGCVLFLTAAKARNEKSLEQNYSLISDSVYESVENALGKPIYTALAMANDTFLRDLLLEEPETEQAAFSSKITEYLSAMRDTVGAQTAFLISDQSRNYYTFSGISKHIDPEHDAHDVWYSVFVNSRKHYDLDVDIDEATGNLWTVFVNTRITDDTGRFLGVCGVGLAMEDLQGILSRYEEKYHVKINFINSDGVVQVDTDSINIENSYLYDTQYGREKDGFTYKNRDGEYVIMRFVENLNWYLVIHGAGKALTREDILPAAAVTFLLVAMSMAAIAVEARRNRSAA